VQHQQVLRLRLSDLSGTLVYASDGAGTRPPADDEALDAARGQAVAQLPRLDTDSGQAGPGVVEAHEPLGTEIGMLTGIRIAGVRISIDNFGAGQTSLGCLASLPIHELKINRAIVMPIRRPAAQRRDRPLGDRPRAQPGLLGDGSGLQTAQVLTELIAASCNTVQG